MEYIVVNILPQAMEWKEVISPFLFELLTALLSSELTVSLFLSKYDFTWFIISALFFNDANKEWSAVAFFASP